MNKKQNIVTIQDYVPYKKDCLYPATIKEVWIQGKRNRIVVNLRHQDSEQDGRLFTTALPLPARLDNSTYCFLKACGIDSLSPGVQIHLKDLIGSHVGIRFSGIDDSGNPQTITFENLSTLTHKKKKDPAHEVLSPQKTKYSSEKTEPNRMAKP